MNARAETIGHGWSRERVREAASARCARWLALVASVAFGIAWTLALGKALHWDAVNYHFYLGFAALNDRFSLDFFAAGTPSYINPYAYVPLYLLTYHEVPAVVAAVLFGAVHALILWLTYELALAVVPAPLARGERIAFAALAMVLAALNPLLLQSLGMTLVDVPLGTLVVAAWLAVAIGLQRGHLAWLAFGAALGGLASGLKLSNAVYAAAALSMVAFIAGSWRDRMVAVVLYCAACGLTFVLVSMPWGLQLWQAFGNPLFPFLNDLFRSPDFTAASLHYERFRPVGLWDYLARPFELLSPYQRRHTEGRAPDLRYAVLFVLGLVAMVRALYGRVLGGAVREGGERAQDPSTRVLGAIGTAFVIAWFLWLKTSANSRYFIPMGCVAAVLVAALLQRAYRRWQDPTLVLIALVLLAQGVQLMVGADLKRDGAAWNGPIMAAKYSDRFREEPYLFLNTSFPSGSGFLQHWHPESGMITTSGFYSLGPNRPGWERVRALLARNSERVRLLTPLPKGYDETTGLPGSPSDLDVLVRRFGLAIDPNDCEIVKLESNLMLAGRTNERERWTSYVTCGLRANPEGGERYLREVRAIDAIFDRVEATCPNLFHPPGPVTEQFPHWTRLYNMGSEMQLWISDNRVLFRSSFLGGDPIDIGSAEAWARAPQPFDCSRKTAPPFGIVR